MADKIKKYYKLGAGAKDRSAPTIFFDPITREKVLKGQVVQLTETSNVTTAVGNLHLIELSDRDVEDYLASQKKAEEESKTEEVKEEVKSEAKKEAKPEAKK